MTIPVFFCGPSFVNSITMHVYMQDAFGRHPDAHLIALPKIGAGSVSGSVINFANEIERRIGPDAPHMVVGQSQGAVVALRYAIDHPSTVKHAVAVAGPFHGAWLSRLLFFFPAAQDLRAGSPLLRRLLDDLPSYADRITNILSPHERVMQPDSCYLDIPSVTNIAVGRDDHLRELLEEHPDMVFDEVVCTENEVNHLNEMMSPELRAVIWRKVDDVSIANGFEPDGVPSHELNGVNPLLKRLLG